MKKTILLCFALTIIAASNTFAQRLSVTAIKRNNNTSVDFANAKNLTNLNDINNVKSTTFSSGINGSAWSTGITTVSHPEMYQNYPKTVIIGSNGNVYGRYFNGTSDVNTIID